MQTKSEDAAQTADGAPVSRRTLVARAAAGLCAAGLEPAAGQAAETQAKGPPVWLDMDQRALDDAYDQSKYAPNQKIVLHRYAAASEATRARLGPPKRFAYGSTPIEALDVWSTRQPNAPVMIFVHGGAWRGGLAKDYAFPAETFIHAGAHLVVLDFINVIEAGGDLMPMIDQVRRAIAWVAKNAASLGGDAGRLYLSGHSSGGHLAGCALITDWQSEHGLPKDVIKGAALCSGMYDLKPVRLSARSHYVHFTDAVEDALSAQRHLDRLVTPVTLLHGTEETPEFQRQTRDFAAAVKAAGKPVRLVVGEGYNHFELMETLANPYGPFGRAALAQMQLAPA
jgi:arylformamidase